MLTTSLTISWLCFVFPINMYNRLFSLEFFFENTLKCWSKINIFDFMKQKKTQYTTEEHKLNETDIILKDDICLRD